MSRDTMSDKHSAGSQGERGLRKTDGLFYRELHVQCSFWAERWNMIITNKHFNCIVNIILLLILHVELTRCRLSDIVKTDDDATIGPPVSPEQAFRFISTGVPHLLWSHVASAHFTMQSNVSTPCRGALKAVADAMSDGHILPYHFVDASGKTPSGFIRSTISSFGDFDQCLAIDGTVRGVHVKGKYCACDLFPVRLSESSDRRSGDLMTTGKLTFDRIHVFKRSPFIHALCVPDQCSETDLRQMLSTGKRVSSVGGRRVSSAHPPSLGTCLLGAFAPSHQSDVSLHSSVPHIRLSHVPFNSVSIHIVHDLNRRAHQKVYGRFFFPQCFNRMHWK